MYQLLFGRPEPIYWGVWGAELPKDKITYFHICSYIFKRNDNAWRSMPW